MAQNRKAVLSLVLFICLVQIQTHMRHKHHRVLFFYIYIDTQETLRVDCRVSFRGKSVLSYVSC